MQTSNIKVKNTIKERVLVVDADGVIINEETKISHNINIDCNTYSMFFYNSSAFLSDIKGNELKLLLALVMLGKSKGEVIYFNDLLKEDINKISSINKRSINTAINGLLKINVLVKYKPRYFYINPLYIYDGGLNKRKSFISLLLSLEIAL